MKRPIAVLLLLAGCSGTQPTPAASATPTTELEAAAIEAGVISDPNGTDISGLYARDADRICIVPATTAYRIGMVVDYGEGQDCGGSGTVSRVGETLRLDFPPSECSLTARFDGDRIVLPGKVPDACQKLCRGRASIAALDLDRLSGSVSEASTMRDTKGRLLCGAD